MSGEPTDEAVMAVLRERFGINWRLTVSDDEIRFLRYCWPLIAAQVRAEAVGQLREFAQQLLDGGGLFSSVGVLEAAERIDRSAADPEAGT